ncbi:hypothetical protein XENOCAPTIV_025937, partial [Xenoophorus captivus]
RLDPGRTNGVPEPRPIDILELLSKAKEEYQRVKEHSMLFHSFILFFSQVKQSHHAATHQSPLLTQQFSTHEPGSSQQPHGPGPIPTPYTLNPSPVFKSAVPMPDLQSNCSMSPLLMAPGRSQHHSTFTGPTASSAAFLGQDMVNSLKPSAPSVHSGIHKPILAPSFLPSTLVPPHSFQEPKKDVFSQPPNLIAPMSVSSVLFADDSVSSN